MTLLIVNILGEASSSEVVRSSEVGFQAAYYRLWRLESDGILTVRHRRDESRERCWEHVFTFNDSNVLVPHIRAILAQIEAHVPHVRVIAEDQSGQSVPRKTTKIRTRPEASNQSWF